MNTDFNKNYSHNRKLKIHPLLLKIISFEVGVILRWGDSEVGDFDVGDFDLRMHLSKCFKGFSFILLINCYEDFSHIPIAFYQCGQGGWVSIAFGYIFD